MLFTNLLSALRFLSDFFSPAVSSVKQAHLKHRSPQKGQTCAVHIPMRDRPSREIIPAYAAF